MLVWIGFYFWDKKKKAPSSCLPFVSFHVVSLDVFEVACEVILQSGHHAAVFVQQLGGSWLRCEPVNHSRQLFLLDLLRVEHYNLSVNAAAPR